MSTDDVHAPGLLTRVEFFVRDPDASIAFYEKLGFTVRRSGYGYTQLDRGGSRTPTAISCASRPHWLRHTSRAAQLGEDDPSRHRCHPDDHQRRGRLAKEHHSPHEA